MKRSPGGLPNLHRSVPHPDGAGRWVRRLRLLSTTCAGVTVVAGVAVLGGWAAGIRVVTSVLEGAVTMRPLTAVGFVALGAGLLLVGRAESGARRVGAGLGLVGIALGLAVLVEYLLALGPALDTLLFHAAVLAEGGRFPGRPSPEAALAFMFSGAALTAHGLGRSRRSAGLADASACLTFFISWLGVLGYLYDLPAFYRKATLTGIAIHAAFVFTVLAVGLLCVRPGTGLLAIVARDSAGALLARRLLPLVTIVPFIGGFILVLSRSLFAVSATVSASVFIAANLLLVTAVTFWTAGSLDAVEQALERSEERMRLAHQVARVGTFDLDLETGVNTWTPELEALHGLLKGTFAGTRGAWEALVHPEDRPKALAWAEQAIETGAVTQGEWRVLWPDGSIRWLAGRWQVQKDESGKPVRLMGINLDITNRKQIEDALAAARDQLAAELAVMKTLPWPVLIVQPDGSVVTSPTMERLLGFAPGNTLALERNCEIATPSGRPLAQADLPWRRSELPFEEEQVWTDRQGNRRSLRIQARRVFAGLLLILQPEGEPLPAERVDTALGTIRRLVGPRGFELPVRELLSMLVQFACELTGARYGAVGVLEKDGSRLRDFVYVGVSDEEVRRIGQLPVGKGLLGAITREGRTLRIPEIAADPRSIGFPAHHPPMHSLLGTPLRIGDRIYGNLYLSEKRGADAFTEEDARQLERFSAEAALAVAFAEQTEDETRRMFRALVAHVPYGIVFYPARGGEPFGNPAAERLLGSVCAEDHPNRAYELLRPNGTMLPAAEAPRLRALQGTVSLNVEAIVAGGAQRRIPALISAAPVLSEEGAAIGAVVVYQDISPIKELEKLRAEFTAMVAHDMRAPVQAVMLQVEVMLRQACGETAWVPVTSLQVMKRSAEHLTQLINDLLDASRIDAHELSIHRSVFDVEQRVQALVQRLHSAVSHRPVNILQRDGNERAWADPVRFDQILTNLVENAAAYSPEGTPIDIEISAARGGVLISVRDKGPGIPADELPHLFERYYRGLSGRAKRRAGTGLGLFISRGLAEAHSGTLTVTSSLGVGTTFEIWLPGPLPVPEAAGASLPEPSGAS